MPVTTNYAPVQYAGNGATASFTVPWPYQFDTDIVATSTVDATGVVTPLVMGTDFAINPIANSPAEIGTLTLLGGGAALPTGTTLTISRDVPITQETSWVPNDPNPSTAIMNAVDKLTMIIQDDNANPVDFGGDTSTFVRGDGSLSNTLVGALGAFTVPSDAQTVMAAGQNGAAAYKVIAGVGAQASYRFANDGSSNPWEMQLVYDPNLSAWGWQGYGGSIVGTFDASGNASFAGNFDATGTGTFGGTVDAPLYTGAADASLITTGTFNVARVGTGSGGGTTFLNGLGQFVIPTGGGGINTTTTAPFTIVAVNSTQTVSVTDATGIVVGTQLQIGDGTHAINGHVTAVASLDLTVKTDSIILGIAGNTMASGAAVQGSVYPGSNTVFVDTLAFPTHAVTTLKFDGVMPLNPATATFVDILVTGITGSVATLSSFIPQGGLRADAITHDFISPGAAGIIGAHQSSDGFTDYILPAAAGEVLNCSSFSGGIAQAVGFSKIGASSITAASLTPALLNCTNSLTNNYLFGYDSGTQHFKMFSPTSWATGTAAQFINGAGAATNVLAGSAELVIAQTSPLVNGVKGMAITTPTGLLDSGQIRKVQYNSGTQLWDTASDQPALTFGCPISSTNATYPITGNDGNHGASESTFGMNLRAQGQIRGYVGLWKRMLYISNPSSYPSSTITIDPGTGPYVRISSILGNFTIALADTTATPTGTQAAYASEVTIEFDSGSTPYTVTWPGTIKWVDGGTAPQPIQTVDQVTIIKLIRAQDPGDLAGPKWFGYRLNVTPSTATGTVTSVATGAGLTGGPITTTGTIAIDTGGVTSTMIAANTVTGGASGNIAINTITVDNIFGANSAPSPKTNYFLNAQGTWTAPSGGSGSFNPGSTYTWTAPQNFNAAMAFNSNNTFSSTNAFTAANTFSGAMNTFSITQSALSSSTFTTKVNAKYPESLYQDANAIDIAVVDNYATPPGGGGIGAMFINHTVTARTIGGESIHHGVNLQSTLTSGFNISHTQITQSKRLNGGAADSVWLNSWGPDSSFSAAADEDGVIHEYNSGFIRIGELNYGNAWADFGRKEDRLSGTFVCGLEFFPDWLNGSTGDSAWRLAHGIAEPHHYNASWAIAIGAAGADSYGNNPRNWTGILMCEDGLVGGANVYGAGGFGINIRGGSTAALAPAIGVKVQDHIDIALDTSSATITAETTSTHSNQAAIRLASGQAICFKAPTGANTGVYIWFNGTNLVASKDGGNTSSVIV